MFVFLPVKVNFPNCEARYIDMRVVYAHKHCLKNFETLWKVLLNSISCGWRTYRNRHRKYSLSNIVMTITVTLHAWERDDCNGSENNWDGSENNCNGSENNCKGSENNCNDSVQLYISLMAVYPYISRMTAKMTSAVV